MTKEVRLALDAAIERQNDPDAPKVDRRDYIGPVALAEQRIDDKINAVKVAGQKVKVRAQIAASAITTKRLQKFTERLEARRTKDRLKLKRQIKNEVMRSLQKTFGYEIAELRSEYTNLVAMLEGK